MENEIDKIINIIDANPDCWIDYHNSGCWSIYSKEMTSEKIQEILEEGDEIVSLYEGDDFFCAEGYIPTLVGVLAKMLEIKVETC